MPSRKSIRKSRPRPTRPPYATPPASTVVAKTVHEQGKDRLVLLSSKQRTLESIRTYIANECHKRLRGHPRGGRPAAIIFDVDHTVLVDTRKTPMFGFDAIQSLLIKAQNKKVKLFAVTAREDCARYEQETKEKLAELNFEVEGVFLMPKEEREAADFDASVMNFKGGKFKEVQKRYDVLFRIGDMYWDVVSGDDTISQDVVRLVKALPDKRAWILYRSGSGFAFKLPGE